MIDQLRIKVVQAFEFASREYRIEKGILFRWREGRNPPACGILGAIILDSYSQKKFDNGKDGVAKVTSNLVLTDLAGMSYLAAGAKALGVSEKAADILIGSFEGWIESLEEAPQEAPYEIENVRVCFVLGQELSRLYAAAKNKQTFWTVY